MSTQALAAGQVRWEQSGDLYRAMSVWEPHPLKQLHRLFTVSHTPLPLQLFRAPQDPEWMRGRWERRVKARRRKPRDGVPVEEENIVGGVAVVGICRVQGVYVELEGWRAGGC